MKEIEGLLLEAMRLLETNLKCVMVRVPETNILLLIDVRDLRIKFLETSLPGSLDDEFWLSQAMRFPWFNSLGFTDESVYWRSTIADWEHWGWNIAPFRYYMDCWDDAVTNCSFLFPKPWVKTDTDAKTWQKKPLIKYIRTINDWYRCSISNFPEFIKEAAPFSPLLYIFQDTTRAADTRRS